MADLKLLSKEERALLYNQYLAASDKEDYARLGEYIPRALATIDQMEQEFESYIHNAAHAARLDRDAAQERQQKSVEALKRAIRCDSRALHVLRQRQRRRIKPEGK